MSQTVFNFSMRLTKNKKSKIWRKFPIKTTIIFVYLFDGLQFAGHTIAYVVHFVFLRDVWARICKPFKESRNRFPAWLNRFLGSLNVYKYGLWFRTQRELP